MDSWLFSLTACVCVLLRWRPYSWPRYRTSSGEKKVAGGKGLKSTQYYTPEFGRGLASWWMAHGPVSAGTAVG